MEELSYSLHLGNDKNKSKRARRTAKTNDTNTTSFNNNAIQNHQQLSKVDKHNLRKYDDEKELICTIKGTSSIIEDTKNLYLELFENARIKYNEKQNRNDRKIENYFNHISNDNKRDLACEIIIELGDMDFWADKDDKFKKKMIEVFKEQIIDLEEVVPHFKIANATIHFDESSPHLHIVGVPFKDGMKNGMSKQVGKSDVFNKISLVNIQDKMREYCINSFNRIYHLNYTLKAKEEGRNVDINVANMNEYKKFKREQEKYKKQLKELNNKTDELQNKSNEINDIIDNLKPTIMNKNNYSISSKEVNKIKKYIEQTNNTTSNLRNANAINIVLKKYEDDLREHSNEVRNLKKKIKTRDDRIEELEYDLNDANETIDELEDKVSELQKIVDYFKELWQRFINFLQNKFFSNDKYDNFINDLYDEEILDENDLKFIEELVDKRGQSIELSTEMVEDKNILKRKVGNHAITFSVKDGKSYYLDPTQTRIYRVRENDKNVLYDDEYDKVPIKLLFSIVLNDSKDYLRMREMLSQQYPSVTREEEKQMIEQTIMKCNGNMDIFEQFYNENSELYTDISSKVLKIKKRKTIVK